MVLFAWRSLGKAQGCADFAVDCSGKVKRIPPSAIEEEKRRDALGFPALGERSCLIISTISIKYEIITLLSSVWNDSIRDFNRVIDSVLRVEKRKLWA